MWESNAFYIDIFIKIYFIILVNVLKCQNSNNSIVKINFMYDTTSYKSGK